MKKICFLLLLSVSLFHCKTPSKSFEKGDYSKSFSLALKECKKGKCSRQNRTIIERSLAALLEKGQAKMDEYEQSDKVKDWEKGVEKSKDLQNKIIDAENYIDPAFLTQIAGLEEREFMFRDRATDVYLDQGMDRLAYAVRYENAASARKAYNDFQKASQYATSDIGIDSLINEAIDWGTIYINVEADMAFEVAFDWDIDREFERITSESDLFNKITYKKMGQFDCIIEVTFDSPNIGFRESTTSENFTRRVIDRYETRRDSSGRTIEEPVYAEVSARVIIREQIKVVELRTDVRIRQGSSNCDFDPRQFYGTAESRIEDIILEGDQRAIPDQYRNVRRENHDSDDDMVESLIEDIYDQFRREYF